MEIKEIYLSWRKGSGFNRHIVGKFKRNYSDGVLFNYLPDNILLAKKDGFISYPEFPILSKVYTEKTDNVLNIISTRLINIERVDKERYLNFWEANNPIYDKFDILALTQGWLPTDQFEFLGVYYPKKGFSFVTDIAGISYHIDENIELQLGDHLLFKKETDNPKDKHAVKIFTQQEQLIGYIKKIHSKFFYKFNGQIPIISIKAFNRNGKIKNIFVKISIQNTY